MKNLILSQRPVNGHEVADEFIKLLSEAQARDERKHVQKKSFAPSSLGWSDGRCPRKWYYAFNGAEWHYKDSAQDVANMQNGIDRHERVQALLKEELPELEADIESKAILDDPPIFGYIDAIVMFHGRRWIIEFKTSKTEYFEFRRNSNEPPLYHLIQVLLYMHITGIDHTLMVYEDKNNHKRVAVPVIMNSRYKAYVKDLLEWMRLVYTTTTGENKKLPMRNFKKDGPTCKDCPLLDTCWADEEGDIKLKSLPKI